jgi:cell division septation protein DedD
VAEITQDATEDGFHEIQLSGKQLVFLFMATTVASVVIFLCGVLVGREAQAGRTADPATDAALTTPAPAPATPARSSSPAPAAVQSAGAAIATAEPPSPPADDELTYPKRLERSGSAPEQLKPPAAARVDPKPEPAKAESAAAKTAAASAGKTAPETAPAGGARAGRWVVQLVALRDRSAASAIVQRLSAKGYPAYLVNPSASTPNQVFKVQIGRYDDRNEAERVSRRLEKEEKFNPWISR